ncbi:cysteine protease, papain C1 family [Legionella steigerwaltii]|uniref:Cysteine protease n=1 Tax=Legionella steigerwaltii TaxID=460 RepID=A0A378LCZ9_9GAMM|nr:C1 family peptidase [Legionella steigerwaltii]KTD79038.1 cysteine protease [Legionella steigerwaltii]STY23629.1 cysteine protease, papain C1 family [Legionella steigerwaltii]
MDIKKFSIGLIKVLAFALLIIQSAFAEDIKVVGTLEQALKQDDVSLSQNTSVKDEKVIQLMHVELSNEAKNLLINHAKDALEHKHQFAYTSPSAPMPNNIKLGMNNVPVLDQGIHGTCTTFAVTAALDATMIKGDYISQLCNLQLGSYLESYGYGPSGWDGSYANYVIAQMEYYGIVNKLKQLKFGCGDLTQYPTYSAHNPESFMAPEKFKLLSEPVFGKEVNWSDVYQRNNPEKNLNSVKQALNAGDRLAFAVLLPRTDLGFVGAVAKYKTWIYKDTWVLTPEIIAGVDSVEAAHEMVITGYDDNAVAVDNNGVKHTGLLFLRNSWGTSVGDYGEFYMSYDYFKLLAYDITRFSRASI